MPADVAFPDAERYELKDTRTQDAVFFEEGGPSGIKLPWSEQERMFVLLVYTRFCSFKGGKFSRN